MLHFRCKSEELESFPLSEVRLLLHRHQQSRGSPQAAPEAGQHPRCWLREVHPDPVLRHPRLQSRREADPLPLQEVSVRCPGPVSDGGPQVQTHERVAGAGAGAGRPSTVSLLSRLWGGRSPPSISLNVRTRPTGPAVTWETGESDSHSSQAEIQFKLHFLTYYLYSDSCPTSLM